jgi:hypothetical protein
MDQHVEHVARAFYEAHDDAQVWDAEPEIIKQEFRLYAQEAIELLAQHDEQGLHEAASIQPVKLAYAA